MSRVFRRRRTQRNYNRYTRKGYAVHPGSSYRNGKLKRRFYTIVKK